MKLKELINILSQEEYKDALEKEVKIKTSYRVEDIVGMLTMDIKYFSENNECLYLHTGMKEINTKL